MACFRNASMDYLDCVKELYDTVDMRWEPGACRLCLVCPYLLCAPSPFLASATDLSLTVYVRLTFKKTNKTKTGTVWDYSSLHLKIAGGMAVAASGKHIRTLLEETLAEVRHACVLSSSPSSRHVHLTHTLNTRPHARARSSG